MHVDFQHSHIDRMPLGDLAETMLTLVVGHPEVNWLLDYRALDAVGKPLAAFEFDDRPVKEILEGVSSVLNRMCWAICAAPWQMELTKSKKP